MIPHGLVEQDILDRLVEGMAPVPIIDTENPDEELDEIGNGLFTPYVGVIWGGPISNVRDRGIVGVRHDLMTAYVLVRVAAPDADTCRLLHNKVFELLTGYSPLNSGEMSPRAGMVYSTGNSQVQPTRYYREHSYAYITNTQGEVE